MISFIIASTGRPTLKATLASIETKEGDEIIVVGSMGDVHDPRVQFIPYPPGRDWGHTERNFAARAASGRYIAHIDDDDVYAPGTHWLMEHAARTTPNRPVLFRMMFPNGLTLWQEKKIRCGNVGTPMFFLPNRPDMFGTWGPFVGGDCHFLETSKWEEGEYVWRSEVIALLGHNV